MNAYESLAAQTRQNLVQIGLLNSDFVSLEFNEKLLSELPAIINESARNNGHELQIVTMTESGQSNTLVLQPDIQNGSFDFKIRTIANMGPAAAPVDFYLAYRWNHHTQALEGRSMRAKFGDTTLHWNRSKGPALPGPEKIWSMIMEKRLAAAQKLPLLNSFANGAMRGLAEAGYVADADTGTYTRRLHEKLKTSYQIMGKRGAMITLSGNITGSAVTTQMTFFYKSQTQEFHLDTLTLGNGTQSVVLLQPKEHQLPPASDAMRCLTEKNMRGKREFAVRHLGWHLFRSNTDDGKHALNPSAALRLATATYLQRKGYFPGKNQTAAIQNYLYKMDEVLSDKSKLTQRDGDFVFEVPVTIRRGKPNEMQTSVVHLFNIRTQSLELVYTLVSLRKDELQRVSMPASQPLEEVTTMFRCQDQVTAITNCLEQAGYQTNRQQFSSKLYYEIMDTPSFLKEGAKLMKLPVTNSHPGNNASFTALLQLNYDTRQCRLICLQAQQENASVVLFPNRQGQLAPAHYTLHHLRQAAQQEAMLQKQQALLRHVPADSGRRHSH